MTAPIGLPDRIARDRHRTGVDPGIKRRALTVCQSRFPFSEMSLRQELIWMR